MSGFAETVETGGFFVDRLLPMENAGRVIGDILPFDGQGVEVRRTSSLPRPLCISLIALHSLRGRSADPALSVKEVANAILGDQPELAEPLDIEIVAYDGNRRTNKPGAARFIVALLSEKSQAKIKAEQAGVLQSIRTAIGVPEDSLKVNMRSNLTLAHIPHSLSRLTFNALSSAVDRLPLRHVRVEGVSFRPNPYEDSKIIDPGPPQSRGRRRR